MLIRDVVHLRNSIDEGLIDVGVVVVPDDRLQTFLPDRTPAFRDAVRYIEEEFKEAMSYPFVVMAIESTMAQTKPYRNSRASRNSLILT